MHSSARSLPRMPRMWLFRVVRSGLEATSRLVVFCRMQLACIHDVLCNVVHKNINISWFKACVQTIVWLDLDALHMFDASANRFLPVSQTNFSCTGVWCGSLPGQSEKPSTSTESLADQYEKPSTSNEQPGTFEVVPTCAAQKPLNFELLPASHCARAEAG